MQIERASTLTVEPSTAVTLRSVAIATARAATIAGSMSTAPGLGPRHERAVGAVRPVGERLGDRLHPERVDDRQQRRAGRGEHRQRRVVLVGRRGDGLGLRRDG